MFRTIFIASVAVVLACCAVWWRFTSSPGPKGRASGGRFPGFERLVSVAFWVSFAVLAATGFPVALLRGYFDLANMWNLTHAVFAAMFAGSLALLLVMRAEAYSLADVVQSGRFSRGQKICFWVIAACGAVLVVTAVAEMFPLLGTRMQLLSVKVHRGCALVAFLACIVYASISLKRKT